MPGFFVAAGLSLNGFGGAGGIGKAVAEFVTSGESELDLQSYRPWRFGAVHRDPVYACENAREAYRYYYRLRYPLDSDVLGRPKRTSALHERMQDAGRSSPPRTAGSAPTTASRGSRGGGRGRSSAPSAGPSRRTRACSRRSRRPCASAWA